MKIGIKRSVGEGLQEYINEHHQSEELKDFFARMYALLKFFDLNEPVAELIAQAFFAGIQFALKHPEWIVVEEENKNGNQPVRPAYTC